MRSRILLLAAAVVLAVPGCGDDGETTPATTRAPGTTSVVTTAPTTPPSTAAAPTTPAPTAAGPTTAAPTTAAPTTAAPTTEAPVALTDVRVYLLREDLLAIGHRQVSAGTPLRGALTALLAGPTAEEVAVGYSSAIPAGTELLGVDLDAGVATVDLSGSFDDGGGTRSMAARLAEVVFTATQLDNVDAVVFHLDGAPVTVFSSEGLLLDGPRGRDAFHDFTSGVLVDTPLPRSTVGDPVVIRGESDSYEANFMVDVYAGGGIVSSAGYQAGGAWGDWRDFEITVPVATGPGPIEIDLYDEGGCGTDPECPPIVHNPLPLLLTP